MEGPFALLEASGTLYETGLPPTEQGTREGSLVRIEPDMAFAGLELDRAGTALGPEAVVFVGRGKVRPGDVVGGERVVDHQSAMEAAQGTLAQGRTHHAGYRMIQYARHLAPGQRWTGAASDASPTCSSATASPTAWVPHASRSAAEFAPDFLARLRPGPADAC
ncbi:hypothetical protein [Streptomyces justiciae]|uniref:Uncharacterized protein n=1 Tax=Streptomyces justiciae TaxID=2780140 RepID=A0ABU3M9Q5_9ACTN|nr:hypothetical protein [Streptomyces justiciae]MDT7847901.1 hypothetical protein [Streptomyces justiciae]